MCEFENILGFLHFSIALDMSRIRHFLAEIMSPKNSVSGNFLTFSMSAHDLPCSANRYIPYLMQVTKG